jgi:hypothetical protein
LEGAAPTDSSEQLAIVSAAMSGAPPAQPPARIDAADPPPRRTLDENIHPPPVTLLEMDEDLCIRGFTFALTRHLHAFHVVAAGSGVWSTDPRPCETPLFSERATRFYLADDGVWSASDRNPLPQDIARHIEGFVRMLYRCVDLEPPVLVYALVLIERFARCAGEIRGTVRVHTLRPLVLTALIIACKLYFDEDVFVGDFTRLALGDDARGIQPLVRCEIAFLRHISYVMVVRPRTFAQYFHAMRNLVQEEAQVQQLQLQMLARAPATVPMGFGGQHMQAQMQGDHHAQQMQAQMQLQHGAHGAPRGAHSHEQQGSDGAMATIADA